MQAPLVQEDVAIAVVDLFWVGFDGSAMDWAGRVEYYENGRLGLLDADPEFEQKLQDAVEVANAKSCLVELVPLLDSDRPGAQTSRVIERTAEDFMEALNRYLNNFYGFRFG